MSHLLEVPGTPLNPVEVDTVHYAISGISTPVPIIINKYKSGGGYQASFRTLRYNLLTGEQEAEIVLQPDSILRGAEKSGIPVYTYIRLVLAHEVGHHLRGRNECKAGVGGLVWLGESGFAHDLPYALDLMRRHSIAMLAWGYTHANYGYYNNNYSRSIVDLDSIIGDFEDMLYQVLEWTWEELDLTPPP